ncbi:unnamed protein product [Owenia fusiformis]|uniref:Uncharacterized protein n=1 Tax=Owenia fusiformis TaxID=6347 RepID=A0A8J1XNS2_OWEFU|nr:unnamed protein product [Owenia fusiformis]
MDLIKAVLVMIFWLAFSDSSRILLAPLNSIGYNSRMRNVLRIGRILLQAGHDVTVIVSDRTEKESLFQHAEGATFESEFSVLNYKTPEFNPDTVDSTANQEWLDKWVNRPYTTLLQIVGQVYEDNLEFALRDKEMWNKIASSKFDLIFADDAVFFPRLVSAYFNIPMIVYSNWGPMSIDPNFIPRYNLAYVHAFFPATFTDEMTFTERFMNVVEFWRIKWTWYDMYNRFISICREHSYGDACDNIRDAYKTISLIMMNRNDAVHYPAPYMPHIISVEGFFLKSETEPLETEYRNIIKEAGEQGIIVASFGSTLRRLSPKMREKFATAFAAMPQTVIWSYEGPPPKGLGNNTIVNKWIPQESLLAHPSTKLFVTHCGASALFQALHYGIPTVGLPFFWDQPFNCHKLTHKIMSGKTVMPIETTSEELKNAMQEVINDERYKHNANKTADIYHSQPIDPKKKLVYWIEYVIKHKGAHHLRSNAENELNVFQYYLLDIIALVVCSFVVFGGIIAIVITHLIKYVIYTYYKLYNHKMKKD